MLQITSHPKLKNVYWLSLEEKGKKLATKNYAKGGSAYVDEWIVENNGIKYRVWDPYRSKLAAAIYKGLEEIPIEAGASVLYLGAASGTTASFVSDVVDTPGKVYCVEISSRPIRDLLLVCSKRSNMVPILADARDPASYAPLISKVDVIYQDIAQPDQVDIFLKNAKMFLPEGGQALLTLKARSIDVTKEPREIFRNEMEHLQREVEVLDVKILDPYERDHAMLLLRK